MEIAKSEIAGGEIHAIPVEGAVTMLPNDPLVQGPKIFAKNCAACHFYDGKNGQGVVLTEEVKDEEGNVAKVEINPTAADLGNFGSRAWMKSVLTDYPEHFAPLKNAQWYKDIKKKEEAGDEVGEYLNVDESGMASWMSEYGDSLLESDEQAIDALAEYFYGKSIEADLKSRQFESPEYDKTLAKKGAGFLEEAYCAGCHQNNDYGYEVEPPKLDGYGSSDWLKGFISNPGADRFYGEKNQMPAYEGKLTEHELDMLVRWMTGDYAPTELDPEKLKVQKSGFTATGEIKETTEE
jgi:ubiquinol-cytochrome c reductase cytochrome b subunit